MNRVDEIVSAMQSVSGSPYAGMDRAALSALIEQEWDSGNWVMLTGKDPADFWGWLSYYRFDKESLTIIKRYSLEGCIQRRLPVRFGQHLYLCNCVTAPHAPKETYRRLYSLAVLRNPQAETINAHLGNRRGQIRWFSRPGKKGA